MKKVESFKSYKLKKKLVPYLFLTPNMLIFTLFIIFPAIVGVYYSFTNKSLIKIGAADYIGFANYVRLFHDADFIAALKNIILLVVITVPIIYVVALGLAMLLVLPLKIKGVFRAIYYWPVMISAIVVGIIWQWILAGNFGLFNTMIKAVGLPPMETLINSRFAWAAVVYAIVWSRSGYYMIIYLAALLSIPQSLYEAASIDGASKFQQFRYVTYPALKAARVMVFILVTMEVFKTYPIVVTLTGGGPFDATKFTVQYIYETAFDFYKVGYASAMSVIMLLFVTVVSAVNFFLSKGGNNK